MTERVKCLCEHSVEEHEFWGKCSQCQCTRVSRRDMTPEETRIQSAFWAGADYTFVRLGRWYGKGHMFYMSHFKTCEEQGHTPHLTSMIAEEIDGVSREYAYGQRMVL